MGILFSSSHPHPWIDASKLQIEQLPCHDNSVSTNRSALNMSASSSFSKQNGTIIETSSNHTHLRHAHATYENTVPRRGYFNTLWGFYQLFVMAICLLISSGRTSETDVKLFNDWLGTLPHRYKIVICGNHETAFKAHQNPDRIKELLTNCTHYLQDSCMFHNNPSVTSL